MTFRPLSIELQKVAESELNEVPDRIQADLNHIREWLSAKPHLSVRKDDQWLLTYLRSSKFNLQRTKDKLELFHKQKMESPEFFHNRDPFLPEIQEILRRGAILVLLKTANGASPKIILLRATCCDPAVVSATNFIKVLLMLLEILYIEDDNSAVAGICNLVDLQDMSYKYLTQLTPNYIRKTAVSFLSAYPTRYKGAHFLNSPSFFQIVYRLIGMFIPAKIKNRLVFHNDLDDLTEVIPKSCLPKEYGGNEKSCDELTVELKVKIESYRDWFLEDTCEKELLSKPKADEQILNVKKSFDNLDID